MAPRESRVRCCGSWRRYARFWLLVALDATRVAQLVLALADAPLSLAQCFPRVDQVSTSKKH